MASCGTTPAESKGKEMFSNRPPAYREGYLSGCSYGWAEALHHKAPGTRDENRIKIDSNYANGWFDGFESCRNSYQPPQSE